MLKFFSRLEKTRGVVIISFAVLVVTGLVVAGYNRGGGTAIANPSNSKEPLAKVGRDEVTIADYTLLKKKIEGQYSQFGGQISLAQLGMTPERILDQAINARVALQEARRLGLTASDEEVRDLISKQFSETQLLLASRQRGDGHPVPPFPSRRAWTSARSSRAS